MRPIAIVLASLTLPVALSAADTEANNYWLRVSASAWLPALSGDLSYRQGNGLANKTSTDSLGLGDSELTPMLDLDIKPPLIPFIPNLHVGFYNFSTDGSETLTSNLTFGGRTFSAGTNITSKAALTDIYAELNWQPLDLDLVGVGLGFGAHSMQAEFTISGGGFSEKLDSPAVIPVLALRAHVNPLDVLGIEVEANGISANMGDFDGTFLDLRLQAVYRPINWLGVVGGYRHVLLDADITDGSNKITFDLTFSGPYLGALVQF